MNLAPGEKQPPKLACFLLDWFRPRVANHGQQAKSGWLPPVFVNKVLFECSHARSFAYRLWFCSVTMAELNSCAGTIWHSKSQIFTIWPFIESLLAPGLGQMEVTCCYQGVFRTADSPKLSRLQMQQPSRQDRTRIKALNVL